MHVYGSWLSWWSAIRLGKHLVEWYISTLMEYDYIY